MLGLAEDEARVLQREIFLKFELAPEESRALLDKIGGGDLGLLLDAVAVEALLNSGKCAVEHGDLAPLGSLKFPLGGEDLDKLGSHLEDLVRVQVLHEKLLEFSRDVDLARIVFGGRFLDLLVLEQEELA